MHKAEKDKPVFIRNPENGEMWEDMVEYQVIAHGMTREQAEAMLELVPPMEPEMRFPDRETFTEPDPKSDEKDDTSNTNSETNK